MFVTLRIILKNIIKGVILSFLSFFLYLLSFPTLFMEVHEASGEKVEFNHFLIFMENFVEHARIYN